MQVEGQKYTLAPQHKPTQHLWDNQYKACMSLEWMTLTLERVRKLAEV